MVRIMERVKNPKWDSLYDAEHKSFFSKFEFQKFHLKRAIGFENPFLNI